MIKSECQIRVRYDEVDKMGYLYHGNYAKYFHIGRTELLRKIGFSDNELEKQNIILPVSEMNIKFIKPVFYDEVITVVSHLKEISGVRLRFFYQIFNQNNELVNQADMSVAFVDKISRKLIRIPQNIYDIIQSKINLT
ncbi:MAG: acyl-CoA thioesterase [Bacteroidales bacterium]|nr:acyl-CoA thioesterase [Bacteroidales bacterium]